MYGLFAANRLAITDLRLHSVETDTFRRNVLRENRELDYDQPVEIPKAVLDEWRQWRSDLPNWNGKPVTASPPDYVIHTDASGEFGWGYYVIQGPPNMKNTWSQGRWSAAELKLHNNLLECLAAEYSIRAIIDTYDLHDCTLGVGIDNTTALSYFSKQAGRHYYLLEPVIRTYEYTMSRNVLLTCFFVETKDNRADLPSREFRDPNDWMLHPEEFQRICSVFGKPELDAFASYQNKQLPVFVSRFPQPHALYCDFLRPDKPWSDFGTIYANPPFCLFERILKRLRYDSPGLLLLVTPWWPSQPFLSALLRYLVDWPLLLPRRPDLYLQPPTINFKTAFATQPNWQTICLPLSGSYSKREEFRRKSQNSSNNVVLQALLTRKRTNGVDGQCLQELKKFAVSISTAVRASSL